MFMNSMIRTNSMSSLHNVDGELPETLGSIKSVTDSQEAVMSFYYTDAANQVHSRKCNDDHIIFGGILTKLIP